MENNITRRDWFKSSLAVTAGMAFSSALSTKLMAAPVSEAEKTYRGLNKTSASKVRLNANENPYGPSERAKQAVHQIMSEGNRYPFQVIKELKSVLAKKEGVSADHIHIGAGSGDLLCQAGVAFGLEGGRIASAFPTFPLLMNYAEVFKATLDKINV